MTESTDFKILIIIILVYVIVLLASLSDVSILSFGPIIEKSSFYAKIETINKSNSSKVINENFRKISDDYEFVLSNEKVWKILRKNNDVTIERLQSKDGGPDFIRTIASFNVAPDQLIQLFECENFGNTQAKIDPFYEDSSLIWSKSKEFNIILKTSKRPLFYPKRLFTLAMTETSQKSSISINDITINNSKNDILNTIPKGTLVSIFSTVHLDKDIYRPTAKDNSYVKAYQDFLAWFIDDKKGNSCSEC